MYRCDIGSTAQEHIYDLLEFDKIAQTTGMYSHAKVEPTAVRDISPQLQEATMTLRECIEDKICAWLVDTIAQERGEHDVYKLNSFFNNVLSERGILDTAIERAREKYSYSHD